MGIITKPYTFTNGEGNNADATQVNADLDALYTLVNGNIEAANIKDSTITLAKFASSVKVIEAVYEAHYDSGVSFATTTDLITKEFSLVSARYCFILAKSDIGVSSTIATDILGWSLSLKDGTTDLEPAVSETIYFSADTIKQSSFCKTKFSFSQLSATTHTIKLQASGWANDGTFAGIGYNNRIFIVVFNF